MTETSVSIRIRVPTNEAIAALNGLVGQFNATAAQAKATLGQVEVFQGVRQSAADTASALDRTRVQIRAAAADLAATDAPSQAAQANYRQLVADAKRLESALAAQQSKAATLGQSLTAAGVDTARLADEQRRLSAALDAAGQAATREQGNLTRLQQIAAARMTLGVPDLAGVRAQIQSVRDAYRTLQASGQLSFREQQQAAAAMKARIAELRGQVNGLSDQYRRSASALRSLSAPLAVAGVGVGAAGVLGGIRASVDTALQFDRYERALTVVTGSAAQARAEMAYVRGEADRLGLALLPAVDGFTKLSAAVRGTALEGDGARQVFAALAQAATVYGLSADQFAGALTAVQQIVSKGTVSAEELRGQLGERLPGAFQVAARAMGVTTAELGKMLEQGQLLADDFLPRFAAQLQSELAAGVPAAAASAQASFARLKNAVADLQVAFAGSGLLEGLADAAQDLTEAFKDPEFQAALRTFGDTIGEAVKLLVGNATTLLRVLNAWAGAQAGGGTGRAIGSVIGAGVGTVLPFGGPLLGRAVGAAAGGEIGDTVGTVVGAIAGAASPDLLRAVGREANDAASRLGDAARNARALADELRKVGDTAIPQATVTQSLTATSREATELVAKIAALRTELEKTPKDALVQSGREKILGPNPEYVRLEGEIKRVEAQLRATDKAAQDARISMVKLAHSIPALPGSGVLRDQPAFQINPVADALKGFVQTPDNYIMASPETLAAVEQERNSGKLVPKPPRAQRPLLAEEFQRAQAELERGRRRGQFGDQPYFAARRDLNEGFYDAQTADLERQRRDAKTGEDQAQLDEQFAKVRAQRQAALDELLNDERDAAEKAGALRLDLERDTLRAQGREREAAQLDIETTYRQHLDVLKGAGIQNAEAVADAWKKAQLQALDDAALSDAVERVRSLREQLAQEVGIGRTPSVDANDRLDRAESGLWALALKQRDDAQAALDENPDDTAAQRKLERAKAALDELSRVADQRLQLIASTVSGSLADAFDTIIENAHNAGDAFENMGNVVVAALRRIVAQMLAMQVINAVLSPFGYQVTSGGVLTETKGATGGVVQDGAIHRASGGPVTGPGGPTDDRVPAMLSNGEFVIQAAAVRKFGVGMFAMLNAGFVPTLPRPALGLATGGLVGGLSGRAATAGGGAPVVELNIINQAPGVEVAAGERRRGGNGREVQDVIVRAVKGALAGGDLDPDLARNFGLRRNPRGT